MISKADSDLIQVTRGSQNVQLGYLPLPGTSRIDVFQSTSQLTQPVHHRFSLNPWPCHHLVCLLAGSATLVGCQSECCLHIQSPQHEGVLTVSIYLNHSWGTVLVQELSRLSTCNLVILGGLHRALEEMRISVAPEIVLDRRPVKVACVWIIYNYIYIYLFVRQEPHTNIYIYI